MSYSVQYKLTSNYKNQTGNLVLDIEKILCMHTRQHYILNYILINCHAIDSTVYTAITDFAWLHNKQDAPLFLRICLY